MKEFIFVLASFCAIAVGQTSNAQEKNACPTMSSIMALQMRAVDDLNSSLEKKDSLMANLDAVKALLSATDKLCAADHVREAYQTGAIAYRLIKSLDNDLTRVTTQRNQIVIVDFERNNEILGGYLGIR